MLTDKECGGAIGRWDDGLIQGPLHALLRWAYDKACEDCAQACLTIYAPGALMCADKCRELTHAD